MLRSVLLAALLTLCAAEPGHFAAYWNIPLQKCENRDVHFDLDQFNIIHNTNNTNRGDHVNVYYMPGAFPYFDADEVPINGGIPQDGNLTEHILSFTQWVSETAPPELSGVSVLDFEKYLPANNGYLGRVGREASRQWVRDRRPDLDKDQVEEASVLTFNVTVQPFFRSLLKKNQELNPDALIGYYKYPPCKNYDAPYLECKPDITELNDQMHDIIFDYSTALFPSVYAYQEHGSAYLDYLVTILEETIRINIHGLPVFPFYWYKYHSPATDLLSNEEAIMTLWTIRAYGLQGAVLWGTDDDLNTTDKCTEFREYVYSFLGPVLKCVDELPDPVVAALARQLPTTGRGLPVAPPTPQLRANRARLVRTLKDICHLP